MVSSYQTKKYIPDETDLKYSVLYNIKSIEPFIIANDGSRNVLSFNIVATYEDINSVSITLRYAYNMESVGEYGDLYERVDFVDKKLPLNILHLNLISNKIMDFECLYYDAEADKIMIIATEQREIHRLIFDHNQHFASFVFILNYCSSKCKRMDFMLRNSIINGKEVPLTSTDTECETGYVAALREIVKIYKVKVNRGYEYHASLSLHTKDDKISLSIPIDCLLNIKGMKKGTYEYGVPEYDGADFITTIFTPIYIGNFSNYQYAALAKHLYGKSYRSMLLFFDNYTIDVIKNILLTKSK